MNFFLFFALLTFGGEPSAWPVLPLMQALAEKGLPEVQYQLGLGCYEGKAVSKDMAEAVKWLTLSANQGEKRARTLLQEVKLFGTPEEIAEGERRAAAERPPTNRLAVALLGWENKTGDAAAAHWREAEGYLLGAQLWEVRGLRILGGVEYGLRQLKKKVGDPLQTAEARKVGELIEARRVVWGSFQREGEKWAVALRVLNVATGATSKELCAASTNWYEIRDQLSAQIVQELGVSPTATERRRMAWRDTTSNAAMESFMRAQRGIEDKVPLEQPEHYARQAVAADPQCAGAHLVMAVVLVSQGKRQEAEAEAREALRIKPDYGVVYHILGFCLVHQKKYDDAEKSLRVAARLLPGASEPVSWLGQMYRVQDRLDSAIVQYEKALQLNPFDSSIHAELGYTYALQRQREKSLAELKEAERLTGADDVNTEQMLAMAYYKLRDPPSAVKHLERFVTLARTRGLNPEAVKSFETSWEEMKARLAPVYMSAAPPKDYSTANLAETLRQKLTPEEFGLVTNPLACTPEMNRWAEQLTKGATNDLHKAKMLFDSLARLLNAGKGGKRTAPEVFAAWNDPNTSFRCLEHAFLYVALARSVGLRAYFADVEQDAEGDNVIHACACVCFAEKVLLVDPAYFWFGAPHKKFIPLDDLQTVSHFVSQIHNLRLNRVAVKLCPDLALVQFNLACELMNESLWEEARQVLATALKMEPDGYMANLAKGNLAMYEVRFEEAIGLLKKASKINATDDLPHLLLSRIYVRQGKLRDARDELRQALRCTISEKDAEEARRVLAELNEKLGGE